jgi:hypothetical protein
MAICRHTAGRRAEAAERLKTGLRSDETSEMRKRERKSTARCRKVWKARSRGFLPLPIDPLSATYKQHMPGSIAANYPDQF